MSIQKASTQPVFRRITIGQIILIVIGALFFFSILIGITYNALLADKDSHVEEKHIPIANGSGKTKKIKTKAEILSEIESNLEAIKAYSVPTYTVDPSKAFSAIEDFKGWWLLLDGIQREYNDNGVNIHASEMKSALSRKQAEVLPELRKGFAEYAKNELWAGNVDVYLSGERNTVIRFVSVSFYNRATVKDFHDKTEKAFYRMRFKKVVYDTGIDTSYSFNLYPPKDSEKYIL